MQTESRYPVDCSYVSPRELSNPQARQENNGYTSPKLRINPNKESRAAKTVGKHTSGLQSLDQSLGKTKTQHRSNKRNFLPSSSGVDPIDDSMHQIERSTTLRMVPNANNGVPMFGNSATQAAHSIEKVGQTLHGRLMDIKEQLNPLLHEHKSSCSDQKYQSKFRRSGIVKSNGVYEKKSSLPMGQDILTDGGIKALSKLESTPLQNYNKAAELARIDKSGEKIKGSWPNAKDSFREDANISYKSASRVSNYDTVAVPCSTELRKSAFKMKPSSISFVVGSNGCNNSSTVEATPSDKNKAFTKSNVFLRAARSITKTKSVSGNFIVKTTICKSNQFNRMGTEDASAEGIKTSMPNITNQCNGAATAEISPKATEASQSKFISMQMTPNPLIKNSFASPVKDSTAERASEFQAYGDAGRSLKHFSTMSSNKKQVRGQRENSTHSINTANQVGSAIMAIPIQKIDISQFSNQMEHVPKIKGIKKQLLLQLYVAKCQDLVINTSKQQMLRFFDFVVKNHAEPATRKLNFSDMALGDQAVHVICKIIKNNTKFAELDLSKNCFTNTGLKQLAKVLQTSNQTLIHLSLGGNNIQTEGAMHLFKSVVGHPSLTSLDLANNDCYKNKVKIGGKGAEELGNLLRHPMCLISHLDLTDNALTSEALQHLISGVKQCRSLISLNLAQNDLGQSTSAFNSLLQIFKVNDSQLQELNLSDNQLGDRQMEELSAVFKQDRKLSLSSLNLAQNVKCKPMAFATLLSSLSNNNNVPLSRLVLNGNDLEVSQKSGQSACFHLTKAFVGVLSCGRYLSHLSIANCGIGKEIMLAIGEGLFKNNRLQVLNMRGNRVKLNGIKELVRSCFQNSKLALKSIDLSQNQLCDQAGYLLCKGLKFIKGLECINMRGNNLAEESGDILSLLVKENRSLLKISIELNLIKPWIIAEIEKQCKQNKLDQEKYEIIKMRRELRGLRKMKDSKVNSELKAINSEIQKVDIQQNLLSFLKSDFENQMQDNMEQIEKTEAVIEDERTALRAHYDQMEEDQRHLQDQLFQLDKVLRNKDKEQKKVQRDWERRIEQQKDQVQTMQHRAGLVEKQLNRERKKIDDHAITKSKNAEYARLTQELEAIEKNNNMLKLIELQYQREIERRIKKEEKVKLEEEIGQKIIDSPLRRAREYACSLAGSPSPLRRIVRKGTYEFSISPSKACHPDKYQQQEEGKSAVGTGTKTAPFGLTLQKRGVSKTMRKAATGAMGSNSAWQTPDKKVTSIASAAASRSVSKSGIGGRILAAAKKAAF